MQMEDSALKNKGSVAKQAVWYCAAEVKKAWEDFLLNQINTDIT